MSGSSVIVRCAALLLGITAALGTAHAGPVEGRMPFEPRPPQRRIERLPLITPPPHVIIRPPNFMPPAPERPTLIDPAILKYRPVMVRCPTCGGAHTADGCPFAARAKDLHDRAVHDLLFPRLQSPLK